MNKKLVIFILMIYCFVYKVIAQDGEVIQPKKEVVVKVYSYFLYFNSNYNPRPYNFSTEPFRFWGITPAVSFRESRRLMVHEFEPKFWASVRDDNNIEEYEVGLRYELNWYLKKDIFPGFRFRYGPSARIYYYHADVKKDVMNGFPVVAQNGGLEFSFSIHFEYLFSDHFRIEISSNNFNFNFAVDDVYYDNPALTERQKSQGGFDFEVFGQRILRIGIGYEL
jgi:hypothetical protein